MRLLGIKIISCIVLLNISIGYAQQTLQLSTDTLPPITTDSIAFPVDTVPVLLQSTPPDTVPSKSIVVIKDTTAIPLTLESKTFTPNPKKAVIYSAIFPGLGQVYNRKYWKLPIVYAGFIGFAYAISWNGRYYTDYSNGYKDIMDDDPMTDSWKNFLSYGQDPETVDQEWLKGVLKRRKDYYRRYRDLSIIGTIAMYALTMIDAYIDAQLFDFNINSDLSLHVEPTVIKKTDYLANSFGVQFSISF